MKLRIIRESWRDNHTAEIKHEFYIQKYCPTYFGFWGWKYLYRTLMGWGDIYTEKIFFDDEEKAKLYLQKMLTPIPPKQVISCGVSNEE